MADKIIIGSQPREGIGSFLSIIQKIELLLQTVGLNATALRSHLPITTSDPNINTYLGFHLAYNDILPWADKRNPDVISATELLGICESGGNLSGNSLEIRFFEDDFASLKRIESYILSQADRVDKQQSPLSRALNSCMAKHVSVSIAKKINHLKKIPVFVHIRRGDIAFLRSELLSDYLDSPSGRPYYFCMTGDFIEAPEKHVHGYRYIPVNKYMEKLNALINETGREKLFIVASTDGFSKVLNSIANHENLKKPVNNALINLISQELKPISDIADLFLDQDNIFTLRQAISYAAISKYIVKGPSSMPLLFKSMFNIENNYSVLDVADKAD